MHISISDPQLQRLWVVAQLLLEVTSAGSSASLEPQPVYDTPTSYPTFEDHEGTPSDVES